MEPTFEWSSSFLLALFVIVGLAIPAIVEFFDDRTQHDLQHDLHDDKMHHQY